MTNLKKENTHLPCPDCNSSDALCKYEDGHTYCFSCQQYHNLPKKDGLDSYFFDIPLEFRGIKKKTFIKYRVHFRIRNELLDYCVFPLGENRWQYRDTETKRIWMSGEDKSPPLFGQKLFQAGSAKAITITEGYYDALAAYQMLGDYPVVAVQGSSSAKTECTRAHDYLNSFDTIVLCFDADEQGRKAAKEVASLFEYKKVKFVDLTLYNDPNDYLENNRTKAFVSAWWNAKHYTPDNIISSFSDIFKLIDEEGTKPSVEYPWKKIQEMTYGIRTGEIVLLTGLEGIGKTEIVRALEYHLMKHTSSPIGIIHLEESKVRTIKGLVGLELGQPVHLPTSDIVKEDIKNVFKNISGNNERVHLYSNTRSDDPNDLIDAIRFMVSACGCKYIFLDHITMVVTGLDDIDERRLLDTVSTKLANLIEELDFTLFLVSHVNDDGLTRGSRNISKVADLHIHLDRDKINPNPTVKNTTELTIKKNRFGAFTGNAGKLYFDNNSFSLREIKEKGLPI